MQRSYLFIIFLSVTVAVKCVHTTWCVRILIDLLIADLYVSPLTEINKQQQQQQQKVRRLKAIIFVFKESTAL